MPPDMAHVEVASGVAKLTLASGPVNALSHELLDAIERALDGLEGRDDFSVLVLASTAKVFSAGGDLQTMAGWMRRADVRDVIGAYATRVQRIGRRLESLPQVTIALCERSALGGGLELALACDVRIASARASFGLPEVGLGLLPAAGGTQRLTRLCGRGAALRLILGAETIDVSTARELGLVQWVLEPETFANDSARIVARFAALPRHAQQAAKACIALAGDADADAGYQREVQGLASLAASAATVDLVESFLAGARRPANGKP